MLKQHIFNLIVFITASYTFELFAASSEILLLKEHEVINTQIKGSEKHRYQIELTQNQFAEFRLVQQGVDLMITTFNNKGEKIEVFDLTSSFGEELATITSAQSGSYALEIQPFNESKTAANYSLELKRISAKAVTPSEKVDQYLARWDSASSPGLAIGVVKNGELIYSKGFGLANLEYAIPNAAHTVFDVASISKQFTAFAILLLADNGQLSIDDEVSQYLPELSQIGRKITLRHLLNHTSGLREVGVLREMAGWREDDISTEAQAFKLLTRQKDVNFEPGETFEYSNSGYFLLAQVVSKVSGQSFAAFTKKRIFEPLGMFSSSFPTDYREVIANKAYSYQLSTNGFAKKILNSTMVGSTGLNTTVEDLAKWATNFEQVRVGNLSIIQQMKTLGVFNNGETTNYAFGQTLDNYRGAVTLGHGGTIAGFKTYLLRIPSQQLSVVVLANLPNLNPLNSAYEIAGFYLSALPQSMANSEVLSKETLARYVGNFDVLGGMIHSITLNDQQLYLQNMGGAKMPLTHIADNEFSFGHKGRKLILSADKIIMVEGIYGGQILVGQRIKVPNVDVSQLDLSEFTGRFYSQELDTSYEFVLENNQLKAQNLRSEAYFSPYDIDTFAGNTGSFLRTHFIRNSDAKITGLEVSGTLVNKLKFVKTK